MSEGNKGGKEQDMKERRKEKETRKKADGKQRLKALGLENKMEEEVQEEEKDKEQSWEA